SPWLAGAVATPLVPGVELSLDVVTVTDGVAAVDLSPEAGTLTPQERSVLQAQIEAVLLRVPGIRSVVLSVGGAPLLAVPAELVRDPAPTSGPLMLTEGGNLVRLVGTSLEPVEGVATAGLVLSDPAMAADGSVVALE